MKGYLLDTHIILWLADNTDKLSQNIKSILINPDNVIYFSPINLWEIAIKNRQSRQVFQVDSSRLYQLLLDNGFIELSLVSQHVKTLETLPIHHKDPFDRMLIAQAISEDFYLISQDGLMKKYSELKLIQK